MNSSFAYLPPNERKKILLICDDLRVHSGVATVAREIVLNTAQHFNWVQIAGAINHPDKGKKLDLSNDTNNTTGLKDASVCIYPIDGYGDANFVRQLINIEKPDAIFLMIDVLGKMLLNKLKQYTISQKRKEYREAWQEESGLWGTRQDSQLRKWQTEREMQWIDYSQHGHLASVTS